MILQIPVENGHEGSQINIKYNDLTEKFNTSSLENAFHTTIYFADCDLNFEPITRGWMLAMMFNLSWKNALPLNNLQVTLPAFLKTLVKLEDDVESWICEEKINEKLSLKMKDSLLPGEF